MKRSSKLPRGTRVIDAKAVRIIGANGRSRPARPSDFVGVTEREVARVEGKLRRAAERASDGVQLDELSDNETRVLFAAHANGPSKIGDLAAIAWADRDMPRGVMPDEQHAQSWVRNALRRLVASGWMRQLGPGTYAADESLEARLLGLQVADAEEAHEAAERELRRLNDTIDRLDAELLAARTERAAQFHRVSATWKALLAARKAVR